MRHTSKRIYGGAALALLAIAVAGCGSSTSPTAATVPSATANSTTPSTTTTSGTVIKTVDTTKGTVLTDSSGYTMYWFAKDHGTTSACTGSCASAWPPVTVTGTPKAGVSLPGKLGTISRGSGVMQLTYDGHPLYTYAGDSSPGAMTGNDINGYGGLWWAMTTTGATVASSSSTKSSGGGSGW
jgi:predicted lipoprotein with Yx(FWY)xxD motif